MLSGPLRATLPSDQMTTARLLTLSPTPAVESKRNSLHGERSAVSDRLAFVEAGGDVVTVQCDDHRAAVAFEEISMSNPWRFRRCPACQRVAGAGEYPCIGHGGWGAGSARRRCPACGHEGQTSDFAVVRERHAPIRPAPARAVRLGGVRSSSPQTPWADHRARLAELLPADTASLVDESVVPVAAAPSRLPATHRIRWRWREPDLPQLPPLGWRRVPITADGVELMIGDAVELAVPLPAHRLRRGWRGWVLSAPWRSNRVAVRFLTTTPGRTHTVLLKPEWLRFVARLPESAPARSA